MRRSPNRKQSFCLADGGTGVLKTHGVQSGIRNKEAERGDVTRLAYSTRQMRDMTWSPHARRHDSGFNHRAAKPLFHSPPPPCRAPAWRAASPQGINYSSTCCRTAWENTQSLYLGLLYTLPDGRTRTRTYSFIAYVYAGQGMYDTIVARHSQGPP